MTRQLIIFAVTFVIGAVIAVILRTGSHSPYAESSSATAASMSMNEHAHSAAVPTIVSTTTPSKAKAVNSICAICGMPVKPELGTITYHGQEIGFGCPLCPPKFKADPDKYGPAALSNKVVE